MVFASAGMLVVVTAASIPAVGHLLIRNGVIYARLEDYKQWLPLHQLPTIFLLRPK
jgi:hypothetical protein